METIREFPAGLDKANLIKSYSDSLKIVWITMCGLSAVALVASLWTEGLDINQALETDHAFQPEPRISDMEKT